MDSQGFILALPVEIKVEIFLSCLPLPQEVDEMQSHTFPRSHPISTAAIMIVRLSEICRSWRAISLDTPGLWSTLYLDLDAYSNELLKSQKKFNLVVDRWIRRARLLPLSMIIRATQDGPFVQYPRLLNELIPRYADRLHTLKLFSSDQILLDWEGFPVYAPIRLIHEAPQLREVRLKAYAVDSFFILPCHHLTSFTGEISSMDIFQLAPGLVEAVVSLAMEDPCFEHESGAMIMHFNLRSLAFFCGERGQYSPSVDALQFLTLPALEKLHMCQTNAHDHDTHDTFSSFLSRSSPPLRILSMSVSDMPPTWETQFATSLRTLERLRLIRSYQGSPYETFAVQKRLLAWLEVDAQNHLPELLELVFSTADTRQHEQLLRSVSHYSPGSSKARAFRFICERTKRFYLTEHNYILPGFSFSGTDWVIVKPVRQDGSTPG
ncbi:hypothetical protein B0H11DRAFT_2260857 [Mycena galericulata]|nr:hypothetical protein B0H11DRAFT_2260857 [Mycena galericulata]